MFDSLRAAFREAVDNFRTELHRDEVPETVDRLLSGMKREAAEARARVHSLEETLARTVTEAEQEAEEVATCRRRERLAESIGDTDTARIAAEYALKHQRRHEVLERKRSALDEELALCRAEADEMIQQIREAAKSRDELAAAAGRTQARESVRAGDDLFGELDRMASEMGPTTDTDEERTEDWDRELHGDPVQRRDAEAAARLEELKRRMGR